MNKNNSPKTSWTNKLVLNKKLPIIIFCRKKIEDPQTLWHWKTRETASTAEAKKMGLFDQA